MNDPKLYLASDGKIVNQEFWENLYLTKDMGWDMGKVSPPLKVIIDEIEDKNCRILIPGCGNSYEAEYLLEKGFTNVSVIDIAPTLVNNLQNKFKHNSNIRVFLGDFFEHHGEYDLILEHVFFCAIPPTLRKNYVEKMHQLLVTNGRLTGLLFNKYFEETPPFGGNQEEYELLFGNHFEIIKIELCTISIPRRANNEFIIEFKK